MKTKIFWEVLSRNHTQVGIQGDADTTHGHFGVYMPQNGINLMENPMSCNLKIGNSFQPGWLTTVLRSCYTCGRNSEETRQYRISYEANSIFPSKVSKRPILVDPINRVYHYSVAKIKDRISYMTGTFTKTWNTDVRNNRKTRYLIFPPKQTYIMEGRPRYNHSIFLHIFIRYKQTIKPNNHNEEQALTITRTWCNCMVFWFHSLVSASEITQKTP